MGVARAVHAETLKLETSKCFARREAEGVLEASDGRAIEIPNAEFGCRPNRELKRLVCFAREDRLHQVARV